MATLTITYDTEQQLVRKLRAQLLHYEEWITPQELRNRYRLTSQTLTMRLKRWQKNGLIKLEAQRGPTGRVNLLKVTPQLRAKMEALKS